MALPVSLYPICDAVQFRLLARFLFRRVVEAEAADAPMSTAIKDGVSVLAVFDPAAVYFGRVTLGRPQAILDLTALLLDPQLLLVRFGEVFECCTNRHARARIRMS